jgi:nicotinamide-nucleotide amidase
MTNKAMNKKYESSPIIQFLLTGTELMTGDVMDSNSCYLAHTLKENGIEIQKKITIGDDFLLLVHEIVQMSEQSDYLIVNGGLGPTSDDLTAQALAKAMGEPMIEHPEALNHLNHWCIKYNQKLEGANQKQAQLPQKSKVIANHIGSAVGFYVEYNHCCIICTPGVPIELKAMWNDSILPMILSKYPHKKRSQTLKLQSFGLGESFIQNSLNKAFPSWPNEILLGYRSYSLYVEIKLTINELQNEALLCLWKNKLLELLNEHIIGEGNITLQQCLVDILILKNQTLSFFEGYTAGSMASDITKVNEAFSVFKNSRILYLPLKERMSKKKYLIDAKNELKNNASDWIIMVSNGIDLSSESFDRSKAKKINPFLKGVYFCWGNKYELHTICLEIEIKNSFSREWITHIAFDLLRRTLLNIRSVPRYFKYKVSENAEE